MANLSYQTASWMSASEDQDMAPGESHLWYHNMSFGEAVSISVCPVLVDETRRLVVENFEYEAGPLETGQLGWRLNYSVRNSGGTFITGYASGISVTNQ